MRSLIQRLLFEDQSGTTLWDLNQLGSSLRLWLSLHPSAARTSAYTIATGINLATANHGNIRLAEFAIIDRVLTESERLNAEGILAHRWWRLAGQSIPLAISHRHFTTPPYL